MNSHFPIVYVRGYAGTQSDVEETVDDPTYGFNTGSTHIRQMMNGKADMFMFVSPFARLFRDHGYQDVIDGTVQQLPPNPKAPERTIWIYRYYDPTSQTFDRPGGTRLTIEQAADGLRDFINTVRSSIQLAQAKALGTDLASVPLTKVYLVAHSMGGLVCRCLLQKIYPKGEASNYVDKLFTYGTPHGGIHFDISGGRLLEKLRDLVGYHGSDNFGPEKMYEFLTPNPMKTVPDNFDPREMPSDSFDTKRVFCVIGTNAGDYAVAAGLSRSAVGPQSDGLVQLESAYVHGAHRAYIHRSHSGRFGMVNSEEGYQNLQRFFFGNVQVRMSLVKFVLDYSENDNPDTPDLSYFVETQVSVRGLAILMHERTIQHYCADAIDQDIYRKRYDKPDNELPLFTSFLLNKRDDRTMRYMIRIALYGQQYEKGFLVFGDHIERLPLWSDSLVVQLEQVGEEESTIYRTKYSWASESLEPSIPMTPTLMSDDESFYVQAPLPGPKAPDLFGTNAAVQFVTTNWR
ncbi:lipase [Alloacidobacterium dinghuense]|uniref:Lipase n=1 Tax=Alloacidobacterium dinghuense TaxID=2763107 RepID=A0A7G8BE74_9BACT|nr:lipase [Alloacidobacterium dinghuense]QNI30844.1 lipase [Alloacidobacterium dinghuense]